MFLALLGFTAIAGSGFLFYNYKNNQSSSQVGINNLIFIANLIEKKEPNSFAIKKNQPVLVFSDFEEQSVYNSCVELQFDSQNNIIVSYFSNNSDDTTQYVFSNYVHEKRIHERCIYKNYSKVDITKSLYNGYSEYYDKILKQSLYAMARFSISRDDLIIFKSILTSFGINNPKEYIEYVLSDSKIPYREDTSVSSSKGSLSADEIFKELDFKLVKNDVINHKFEEIVSTVEKILFTQDLLSIDSTHFIKTTLPSMLIDSLEAFKKMNDKKEAETFLIEILDNCLERLDTINTDKDSFYKEKLQNITKFSENQSNKQKD